MIHDPGGKYHITPGLWIISVKVRKQQAGRKPRKATGRKEITETTDRKEITGNSLQETIYKKPPGF